MSKPPPIRDRILAAYRPGIGYHALLAAVFPMRDHPRAWNTARQGGPPGCAIAFNRALSALGAWQGPPPAREISIGRRPHAAP